MLSNLSAGQLDGVHARDYQLAVPGRRTLLIRLCFFLDKIESRLFRVRDFSRRSFALAIYWDLSSRAEHLMQSGPEVSEEPR